MVWISVQTLLKKIMKKYIFSFLLISVLASSPVIIQKANADICVPGDPDFDAADCVAAGGTVGVAIGIGGGPGGGGNVPIDGGLSIMIAIGGALGARKALKAKKK